MVRQLADALDHEVGREHAALPAARAVPGRALGLDAPLRQLVEVVPAGRRVHVRDQPGQAGQDVLRVAHDRDLDGHVLADLGRVDVRVDDPRIGGVGADGAGDPVVEAHPDGDQEVGRLDRAVDVLPAVHPHVAVGQRVLLVHGADAQQRPRDGDLRLLRERLQLVPGLGDQHAVPGEDQRPLRLGDLLRSQLELLRMALHVGSEARQTGDHVLERGVLGTRLLLQGILGDVHVHGPGTPVLRDVEGLGDDPRDVVGVSHEVVVLGHRQRDAGDVDLLERVLADQGRGHVAGDRHERHGVQLRGGDAGDQVGRAGAAGAHADAHLAAGPGVAVGRVGAALLVPDEDVPDLRVVAEDVVDREDDAARVREERVRALADERLHERVRADAGPLPAADVVEHLPAGLLDGVRRHGAVPRHVAPTRRRPPDLAGRRFALGDRHPMVPLRPAGPATSGHTKTLATRRGSLWFSVAGASAAAVPPCSSVLPPGAGNEEAKKALKPELERAKKVEKGYALGSEVAQGHVDATPVGRHDDDDGVAAATLEEVHVTRLLGARHSAGGRRITAQRAKAQPPAPTAPVLTGPRHGGDGPGGAGRLGGAGPGVLARGCRQAPPVSRSRRTWDCQSSVQRIVTVSCDSAAWERPISG